jgi:transposase
MGRRGYPQEFRRRLLDLVEAGRPVVEVARELGVSAQLIYMCGARIGSIAAWCRG